MLASIVLAILALPVLAVISIVVAMGARERIKRLEFRIAGLEARLAGAGGEAVLPEPAPGALPEPALGVAKTEPAPASGPTAPAPAPPALKPKVSLEERFGTQWVVWAGGIALALGGFFLVRYSIEQGLVRAWRARAARRHRGARSDRRGRMD
jgi:hypothetical protein